MNTLRLAADRGHFNNAWLNSHHSFSFGEYHDPEHMGVSLLRVINDDVIAPDSGFGTHPHREMEIITYQLEGQTQHQDSTGAGGVIRAGDVQYMSAGTGISHSEINPSPSQASHLLQIWLMPTRRGVEPGYVQRNFSEQDKRGKLLLIVSPDGDGNSLAAHTDVKLYATLLDGDESVSHQLAETRLAYVHIARGTAVVAGLRLQAGDALRLDPGQQFSIEQASDAEVLLFDLPTI